MIRGRTACRRRPILEVDHPPQRTTCRGIVVVERRHNGGMNPANVMQAPRCDQYESSRISARRAWRYFGMDAADVCSVDAASSVVQV